jgi:hypothetical protein
LQIQWDIANLSSYQFHQARLQIFKGKLSDATEEHSQILPDLNSSYQIPELSLGEKTVVLDLQNQNGDSLHQWQQSMMAHKDGQVFKFSGAIIIVPISVVVTGDADAKVRMEQIIKKTRVSVALDARDQVIELEYRQGIDAERLIEWFRAPGDQGGCISCHSAAALDFSTWPFASNQFASMTEIMNASLDRLTRRDAKIMPPAANGGAQGASPWSKDRVDSLLQWQQKSFARETIPPQYFGSFAVPKLDGEASLILEFTDKSGQIRLRREFAKLSLAKQALELQVEVSEKEFPKPPVRINADISIRLIGKNLADAKSIRIALAEGEERIVHEVPLTSQLTGYPQMAGLFDGSAGGTDSCTICHTGSEADNGGLDLSRFPFRSTKVLGELTLMESLYERVLSQDLARRMPPNDFGFAPWSDENKALLTRWREAGFPAENTPIASLEWTVPMMALQKPYALSVSVMSDGAYRQIHQESWTVTGEGETKSINVRAP